MFALIATSLCSLVSQCLLNPQGLIINPSQKTVAMTRAYIEHILCQALSYVTHTSFKPHHHDGKVQLRGTTIIPILQIKKVRRPREPE